MEQIIYLEPTDDIISIRDRVEMAEAKRVLLVVPPYSNVLARRVDLQVIQRSAAQAGIDVALVTTDGVVRSQARELGLPFFDSISAGKRRNRWRAPRDDEELAPPRRNDEAWRAAAQRGEAQARAGRHRGVRLALAWLLFFVVLVVFALGAALTAGASTRLRSAPNKLTLPPTGMTANTRNAGSSVTMGASVKMILSAPAGVSSSLKNSLSPSAMGCSRPNLPARFGP